MFHASIDLKLIIFWSFHYYVFTTYLLDLPISNKKISSWKLKCFSPIEKSYWSPPGMKNTILYLDNLRNWSNLKRQVPVPT